MIPIRLVPASVEASVLNAAWTYILCSLDPASKTHGDSAVPNNTPSVITAKKPIIRKAEAPLITAVLTVIERRLVTPITDGEARRDHTTSSWLQNRFPLYGNLRITVTDDVMRTVNNPTNEASDGRPLPALIEQEVGIITSSPVPIVVPLGILGHSAVKSH